MSVWGKGGLFEKALASKIARQDADAAKTNSEIGVDRMNADTSRMDVDNRMSLGLRDQALKQQGLGIDQFNADTNRLAASPRGLISDTVANNLGLRSFNPVGQSEANSFADQIKSRELGTSTSSPSPTISMREDENGQKIYSNVGFMNSGKVPQMKAMAGYGKGGEVKSTVLKPGEFATEYKGRPDEPLERVYPEQAIAGLGWKTKAAVHGLSAIPHIAAEVGKNKIRKAAARKEFFKANGYERGGKIGNVKNDTGKDTIPAKVRPGEYLLNPETVAYVGSGNYDQGVRNLNNMVRAATGKEPGPTPLPKGGEGFADGGVGDDDAIREMRNRFRQGAGLDTNNAGASQYYRDNPELRNVQDRLRRPNPAAWADVNVRAPEFLRNLTADQIARGVGKVAKGTGLLGAAAATAADAYQVGKVAVDDRSSKADVATEAAGAAGRLAAAGAGTAWGAKLGALGGPFAPVTVPVGAIGGGLIGYMGADQLIKGGRQLLGTETRNPSSVISERNAPVSERTIPTSLTPGQRAIRGGRGYGADRAAVAEESAQSPETERQNLRDYLRNRLEQLDYEALYNGGLGAKLIQEEAGRTMAELGAIEREEMQGTREEARLAAAADKEGKSNLEKLIQQRAVRRTVDPETGEINEETDQTLANEFRRHFVDTATKAGIDPRRVNEYEVVAAWEDFINRRKIRDIANARLQSVPGSRISSELLNPNQFGTIRDAGLFEGLPFVTPEGSSADFGDWWTSLTSGGDYDRMIQVAPDRNNPDVIYEIPLSDFTRDENGNMDLDRVNQYPQLRGLRR